MVEFKHVVVFITVPPDKAEEVARVIVEERLGACVNIVREVRSLYWWQGKVEDDKESLLIVKTRADALDRLIQRVKEVHPYTVPEIIALPIVAGNADYLQWVDSEVRV